MELLNLSFLAFLVKSLRIETSSLLSQTPSFYCSNTSPPLLFRTWSTSPKIISSWISFEIEVIPWTLYILWSRLQMWTSLTSYYSALTSIDMCIDKTNLTRKMVIGSQGKVVNKCICGKCDLSIALEQTTTEEQNFIIINSSRNCPCAKKNRSLKILPRNSNTSKLCASTNPPTADFPNENQKHHQSFMQLPSAHFIFRHSSARF